MTQLYYFARIIEIFQKRASVFGKSVVKYLFFTIKQPR